MLSKFKSLSKVLFRNKICSYRKINKTLKLYNSDATTIQDSTKEKEYDDKSNMYLQISACLSKTDVYDNDIEKKEKILNTLKKYSFDPNLEEISKLVDLESDKKIEVDNDLIEKFVIEELSEEEFADDTGVRFIRPPHTKKELKNVLDEADKIYEDNKHILLSNDEEVNSKIKTKQIEKIPNYLTLRALSYPHTDSQILLMGVQRNSDLHSLYISQILNQYSPDLISVHLPPDLPIFMAAEANYQKDWRSFIKKSQDYSFLVNPLPQSVHEVFMSPLKMERLFDYNFAFSDDIKLSPKIIFSKQSK